MFGAIFVLSKRNGGEDMEQKSILTSYYENFNEDGRLQSRASPKGISGRCGEIGRA